MSRPNKIQFLSVAAAVKDYATQMEYEDHEAFLGLVIKNYLKHLDLSDSDVDDSIIDGKNDGGIDAILIDEPDDGSRPTVFVFQSKYHQLDNGFEKTFPGNAITKMEAAINAFVYNGHVDKEYQNQQLQEKLRDILGIKIRIPRFVIIFCSNGDYPAEDAKSRFKDFLDTLNDSQDNFAVEYVHLPEVAKLLSPQQSKHIDAVLQFEGPFIKNDVGNVRSVIGMVRAIEIAKLRESEGTELFDRNVRGYLTRRNIVNSNIKKSASGPESPYFFYLNNGLTITCESYTYSGSSSSPSVKVKNLQIVNGGQTTNSLYEAYKTKELKEDVYVLVRIIQIDDEVLLSRIIASTNSQTAVNSRDLHSNDPIQKMIETTLFSLGFYYEARKDKFRDRDRASRIDAYDAAQAYYAAKFKEPAKAKDYKKDIFGTLYTTIFQEDFSPSEYLATALLYRKTRALNKQYRDKYSFANDAALHTVAALYARGFTSLDSLNDEKRLEKTYLMIMRGTKKVVSERFKEQGEKYSHRKTFIDPTTNGSIEEVLRT